MLRIAACVVAAYLISSAAFAQEAAAPESATPEAAAAEPHAEPGLPWQPSPLLAPIGDGLAEIELPDGYMFLDRAGTAELLKQTGNLVGGNELATVAKRDDSGWFVIFEWDDSGWVDDSDRAELDADALLASLKENDEAANAERRRLGYPELELVGWHEQPHYDSKTNNLTWALELRSTGGESINRLVKLLGRRGVMSATLVAGPEELVAAQSDTDALLTGYRFKPGSTYAEYSPGTDTAAGYGLGALVVGGVLAKTGFLAKFWKLIVGGVLAAGAALKNLLGRRRSETPAA